MHALRFTSALALALLAFAPRLPAADTPREISVYTEADEGAVRAAGAEIWDRGDGYVLAGIPVDAAARLAANRITAIFSAPDHGQAIWLLSHDAYFPAPRLRGLVSRELNDHEAIYLVPFSEFGVELPGAGLHAKFRGVPRKGMPERRMHAADAAALGQPVKPAAANPLVQTIVNATSQASWFQFVRDLSADSDVTIPGFCTNCRIRTRASDYMFPPNNTGTPLGNPFATEYLEMKGAGWGFTGANVVRENYTSADSGCTSRQGAQVWQNLIFTLPGQVDYGQHQQVIFLVHYDTISESAANDANNAPGADDAISGGAALIEAMRLFKDYGWKYPVKFLFVSGEEVGLCGSTAYTRQHPMSDVWRVLNMDQTAFDGNKNGLMNLYNWSVANCPNCVAFGDAFVQANADYGNIIAPAKIVRNTTKMCQTDHCPFWNAGAVAIDLNEDLTNNDICPCFDQSQTAGCRDTVTQFYPTNQTTTLMFDQNYSWPTEKAAIALIAHTAEPLYACPGAGATLGATGSAGQVGLTWGAVPPVTNYVIERATGGCGGTFAGVGQVTSPGYTDTSIVNGQTYGYRIRTCPFQVSNCVAVTPNGPSVTLQQGSALVTADSGDADATADNCERVTGRITVVNDGNLALTNVRITALTADSPAVQVVSPVPYAIGALGIGASVQVPFKFDLGRSGTPATCQQTITFSVTLASDQSATAVRSFPLTGEQDAVTGTITYGFETNGNVQGWTMTPASPAGFTQVAGGATGSTAFSLHSGNTANGCYAALSPGFTPSASSALTMGVNYAIESGNFDRAVIRAVNPATSTKTLLTPTGAVYNTTGNSSGLCDGLGTLQGWSGSQATWRTASFSLAAFAGTPIQLEARYSLDGSVQGTQGFWFDNVQITNATQLSCDAQSNSCAARPVEVSPSGGPVPFTIGKSGGNHPLRFSESAGATKYHVYAGTLASLSLGYYNHGSAAGLCGFLDGSPGDGQVTASVSAATLANNGYFLAVAAGAAGESAYGTGVAGGAIPVALTACP